MDKKILISDKIKDRLWDDLQLCLRSDMEDIILKYNNNNELTKNEIFILGYNLSLLRKCKLDELAEFGYTSDRLFLDELETLVNDMLNGEKQILEYYKLQSPGKHGFTVKVKIPVKEGEVYDDSDIIDYSVKTGVLDKEDMGKIRWIDVIDEDEFNE